MTLSNQKFLFTYPELERQMKQVFQSPPSSPPLTSDDKLREVICLNKSVSEPLSCIDSNQAKSDLPI
ncbi:hypothetical protein RGU72_06215 [Undibacterium sp. 5I1]|uniref:hypothetical protein n=1 Tax=Undibacterium sp. 5I1 TaxID=3048590 RepID=UPI002AB58A6C|nr:hypothetical protein [Undibacterium sp. 5I1]MDY7537849.1 hypothetical protein [Undibacterium sp. 5I1]